MGTGHYCTANPPSWRGYPASVNAKTACNNRGLDPTPLNLAGQSIEMGQI